MSPSKAAGIGACLGCLFGMALLASLPAIYLPGDIQVRFVGKYRGTGMLAKREKIINLTGECKVQVMRVVCIVNAGGPQI